MKRRFISSIVAIGLLWAGQVQAVTLTQWGTSASASSADCSILNCDKFSFLLGNPITEDTSTGGLNQTSAELLDYDNPEGRGTISASVALQGGLSIPLLKAKAESVDANGWVSALAMGIQGYEFTGSDGTTISLDSALTGSVNNTSGSDVTGLSVGVWLIMGDPAVEYPTATTLSDLLLQIALMPVVDSFSWEDLITGVVDRSTTTTDPNDQLQITLNNGDEFYVFAALTAAADGTGAVADAFSTLEMSFNTTQLVPAAVVGVPPAEWKDLIIDFGGSGLWAYMNDSNWLELNSGSPAREVAGDLDGNAGDDVIADFAPSGIWVRRNLGTWAKLNGAVSEQLAVGDLDNDDKDDLIVDFGVAGLWAYMNDTSWLKLSSGSPEQVVIGDVDGNGEDDVIADFGASGIWIKRNQGGWLKLHPIGPDMMAVGDLDDNDLDDVLIDFGVDGLWAYMNNASWLKLLSNSPDLIATGDVDGNGADDVLASFELSGDGLWQKLNLGAWSKLNTNAPDQVVTGDVDGSGKDDIVATFTSVAEGLFIKRNQTPWAQMHSSSPKNLAVGNLDGQ